MSGSNAISGITIIGALIAVGTKSTVLTQYLGVFAIMFASINVVGGFLVTHRMLRKFKRKEQEMSSPIVNGIYLLAAMLFIIGIKGLGHPRSAVRGNLFGALGMLLAIVVTLWAHSIISPRLIIIGIATGSIVGGVLALTIKMTAMPQLVGLYNGFGGIASVLVAGAVLYQSITAGSTTMGLQGLIATTAGGLIGAVTFWGSLVAFAKLQGILTEKPVRYTGEQIVKILFAGGSLVFAVYVVLFPQQTEYFWVLVSISSMLGILLVIPIGGADMPIVVALLNSYSGLAAAATGFVLNNTVLIISGSLVGASGIILTNIMCRAMNRSLANVLFGGIGMVQKNRYR